MSYSSAGIVSIPIPKYLIYELLLMIVWLMYQFQFFNHHFGTCNHFNSQYMIYNIT